MNEESRLARQWCSGDDGVRLPKPGDRLPSLVDDVAVGASR